MSSKASKPCFLTESQVKPKKLFRHDIRPPIFPLSGRRKEEERAREREGSSSLLLFLVGSYLCCFWVCVTVMAEIPLLISHRPRPWDSDAVCTSEGKRHARDWQCFRPSLGYARNSKSLFLEGMKKRFPFNLINTANSSHFTAINTSLTLRDLRSTKTDRQNIFHPWLSGI